MVISETFNRVRSVHGTRGPRACRATLCYPATSGRTSQARRAESKQARTKTETKGYGAFRFGPRKRRLLVDFRFFAVLASDFCPSQTLADDLRNRKAKPVPVVHVLPVVVAEGLLIQIAKQMERSTLTYVPLSCLLTKLQKFSIVLVWTLPFTYSTACLMTACW